MRRVLVLAAVLLSGCGTEKAKENPTNCAVKEVPEGVEFSCVDKDGVASSGVVKHGEPGAKGEKGEKGEPGLNGENGKGLEVASVMECTGMIEGWLEQSAYVVDFRMTAFETGDRFLSSATALMRGDEVLNVRNGAAFYMKDASDLALDDGLLMMVLKGKSLEVSSKGGIKATLACKEV